MGRRGRPPYADVLTPREFEVLELLREGLSNRQIAERLGISHAGAKFHVSEILSKLGVSSREEAARWRPDARPWWMTAFAPLGGLLGRVRATPVWGIAGSALSGALLGSVIAFLGVLVFTLFSTDAEGGSLGAALPGAATGEGPFRPDDAALYSLVVETGEISRLVQPSLSMEVLASPGGRRLAVLRIHEASSTLSVIREDRAVLAEVAIPSAGVSLAGWSPAGQWLVVDTSQAVESAEPMRLLSPDSGSFREVPGGASRLVTWSPSGEQLYRCRAAADRRSSILERVAVPTLERRVLYDFPDCVNALPSPQPGVVATVSSDAEAGRSSIIVHDFEAGTQSVVAQVAQDGRGAVELFAWHPDGDRLVYGLRRYEGLRGEASSAGVYAVDVEDRAIRQMLGPSDLADTSAAWSADGRWLAVSRSTCERCVGDGGRNTQRKHLVYVTDGATTYELPVPAPGRTVPISWSPHGERLLVGGDKLYVFEPGDSALTSVEDFPASDFQTVSWFAEGERAFFIRSSVQQPVAYAMAPDGEAAAVLGVDVELVGPGGRAVARTEGNTAEVVWPGGSVEGYSDVNFLGEWAPDGTALVAVRGQPPDSNLWLLQPGEEPDMLARGPIGGEVRWSPDGSQIAFWAGMIRSVSRTGSRMPPSVGAPLGTAFDWSPDGERLAYLDGNTLKTSGSGETVAELPLGQGVLRTVRWSPDGRHIAVGSQENEGGVFIVSIETGDVRQVSEGWVRGIEWSPDGSRLAFGSYASDDPGVYVVNADGTGLTQLTASHFGRPHIVQQWLEDGRIAFVSGR